MVSDSDAGLMSWTELFEGFDAAAVEMIAVDVTADDSDREIDYEE